MKTELPAAWQAVSIAAPGRLWLFLPELIASWPDSAPVPDSLVVESIAGAVPPLAFRVVAFRDGLACSASTELRRPAGEVTSEDLAGLAVAMEAVGHALLIREAGPKLRVAVERARSVAHVASECRAVGVQAPPPEKFR